MLRIVLLRFSTQRTRTTSINFKNLDLNPLATSSLCQFSHSQFLQLQQSPSKRGFIDASSSGVSHVAVFVAASETFNNKNVNCSIEQSLVQAALIIEEAKKQSIKVRSYVSTIAGCLFEDSINIETVVKLTKKLTDLGCYKVSLGDTIGVATPKKTR